MPGHDRSRGPTRKAFPWVRTIEAEEWRLLRDVRLRALQDSPRAFSSSYDQEVGRDEYEWRAEVSAARWFLAFVEAEVIGAAGEIQGLEEEPEPHVISMWVDPHYRRVGVSRLLLTSLMNQMASSHLTGVRLWVIRGNDVARRAYERMGFTWTGESQPLEDDPSRTEDRMWRPLPERDPASRNGGHSSLIAASAAAVASCTATVRPARA